MPAFQAEQRGAYEEQPRLMGAIGDAVGGAIERKGPINSPFDVAEDLRRGMLANIARTGIQIQTLVPTAFVKDTLLRLAAQKLFFNNYLS